MLLALACQSGHAVWARSPDSAAPTAVVRSQPALRAALAAGTTPLHALTPYGRRQFLAQLRWGRGGLGGYGYTALIRELDHEQLAAALAWLDVSDDLPMLDEMLVGPPLRLPPPSPQAERDLASLRQYVERDYARRSSAHATSTTIGAPALLRHYQELFGTRMDAAALRRQSAGDLAVLFDAAAAVVSRAPTAAALDDLQRIHAELLVRDIPTARGFDQGVMSALLAARRFDAARDFAASRPHLADRPVPQVVDTLGPTFQGRSVYTYDAAGDTLTRVALPVPSGVELVMVVGAGCHFSADALAALHADAALQARLRAVNLVLVTDPRTPVATDWLAGWNAAHPAMPIRVPFNEQEWQALDQVGVPAFYLFRNGKRIGQQLGWQADGKAALSRLIDAATRGARPAGQAARLQSRPAA
ncbi:hypothetical protein C9I28_14490 [Pseudoduganella armeniaca]|uniref:Thioredoxin domain-containing protein n=2 Tax=Pseudoduganella armeniaca TaxID=2072590 RepID=A0A2R4CB60_9BURK|nr:hypothetical protein C9I28_14490 [Pseudoduganella armeniaca]